MRVRGLEAIVRVELFGPIAQGVDQECANPGVVGNGDRRRSHSSNDVSPHAKASSRCADVSGSGWAGTRLKQTGLDGRAS